jgi:hypothetical protein
MFERLKALVRSVDMSSSKYIISMTQNIDNGIDITICTQQLRSTQPNIVESNQ